jgi:hypothetical protein
MANGFVSLDRGSQDMAARAGLALAIRRIERQGNTPNVEFLGDVAHQVLGGLFAFPASSVGRWQGYADGVARSGQQVSNREWDGYSSQVRAAAWEIADHIEELSNRFPTND